MVTGINTDSLKSIFSSVDGREFYDSAAVLEARSQYLANTISDDKGAPVVLSGSQQARREANSSDTKRRRRDEQQRIQLTLAEQARQLSQQLAQQIAQFEAYFEAELGDAWREEIANRVMSPDDIPQRKPGESMQDYRERLETALIAAMIHPTTGGIRPEYANSDDPEVQRYAAWAQARYRQNELANTPPERMQEFFESNTDWAKVQAAEQVLHDSGIDATEAVQRTDDLTDLASDIAAEDGFFGSGPGG